MNPYKLRKSNLMGILCIVNIVELLKMWMNATLLEKIWRISLHVTDDAIAKLFLRKVKSNRGNWSKI